MLLVGPIPYIEPELGEVGRGSHQTKVELIRVTG